MSLTELYEAQKRAAIKKAKRLDKVSNGLWAKEGKREKRIPKATIRKRLVKKLDKDFSLFIRKRDQSVRNGLCVFDWCSNPIQCAFHVVTRSKHIVRWDEWNAVGSCFPCNKSNEYNPHPFIQWYIRKYGLECYDKLLERSNKIAAFSLHDLEVIEFDIKTSMEKICSRPGY